MEKVGILGVCTIGAMSWKCFHVMFESIVYFGRCNTGRFDIVPVNEPPNLEGNMESHFG
jgi:hypothetical protein